MTCIAFDMLVFYAVESCHLCCKIFNDSIYEQLSYLQFDSSPFFLSIFLSFLNQISVLKDRMLNEERMRQMNEIQLGVSATAEENFVPVACISGCVCVSEICLSVSEICLSVSEICLSVSEICVSVMSTYSFAFLNLAFMCIYFIICL